MKTELSLVCKEQYADIVKEKYSPAIAQRHEKISQQEETYGPHFSASRFHSLHWLTVSISFYRDKQLTYTRIKHLNSYENLTPAWYTPSIVIFDEDIEEKIDDFPEFTDAQRQTIRQAMVGSPHTVS